MKFRTLCTKNVLNRCNNTSKVLLDVLDHDHTKHSLLQLDMLPQESSKIFDGLQKDKVYLFKNVGFQLLFITEIGLVFDSFLPDDDACAHSLGCVWILSLGLFEKPRLFIAMAESICPQQGRKRTFALKAIHSGKLQIILDLVEIILKNGCSPTVKDL